VENPAPSPLLTPFQPGPGAPNVREPLEKRGDRNERHPHPTARRPPVRPRRRSGAASVLLAVFFASGEAWRSVPGTFAWTSSVHDVLVAIQFAALVPVAVALRAHVLAETVRPAAMTGVVVLQALPLAGPLEFETQVWWVVGCFVFVFAWMVTVSRAALPRTVARAGTVIGTSYIAGALPSESSPQFRSAASGWSSAWSAGSACRCGR
jgi:hypothetical protein